MSKLLANLMGLHLGCPVKCKRYDEVGTLYSVDQHTCKIMYKAGSDTAEYLVDCKLLLKPLSAISEEDKAEFLKFYPHKKSISHFGIDGEDVFVVFIDSTDNLNYVPLSTSYCMWLCTKGYDVGIVHDEYKEIVE